MCEPQPWQPAVTLGPTSAPQVCDPLEVEVDEALVDETLVPPPAPAPAPQALTGTHTLRGLPL